MPGPLLYQLLKTKSEYPLHSAVRLQREDVVFLYLVEHNAEVRFFFIRFIKLIYLFAIEIINLTIYLISYLKNN